MKRQSKTPRYVQDTAEGVACSILVTDNRLVSVVEKLGAIGAALRAIQDDLHSGKLIESVIFRSRTEGPPDPAEHPDPLVRAEAQTFASTVKVMGEYLDVAAERLCAALDDIHSFADDLGSGKFTEQVLVELIKRETGAPGLQGASGAG